MTQPIFRSVEVVHGQHLVLGEPIPPAVLPDLSPAGPGRWLMRPGTFHRATSIEVDVGTNGAVTQMVFAYAEGTAYAEMLENFENEIGPPDSQTGSAPARDLRSVWTDSETRFTLFERPNGEGASVGSQLENRAAGAA